MSQSTLTFPSTQTLRDSLLGRNLSPYSVPGVYSPAVNQIAYEFVQSNYSVINSPDELIANDPFANQLYPLNEYGPTGGYDLNINYNGVL